jgi:ADP-ribosyl-[dinitrogen reductase] hydrolase
MIDHAPLVGEAVGDALGMSFETKPADHEALLQWDGETFHASEYHGLSPGQWTDDTMMATFIAESLVACGGYYPRDVADRYRGWYRSGDHRGMGKTTRAALTNLDNGVPWNRSGIPGAEGNGTAMRAAPLGFYFHEDLVTTREFAQMDARITHASLEAEMGSIAVGIGIALLTEEAGLDVLVERVLESLEDSKVKQGLQKVAFYQRQPDISAAEALRVIGTSAHVTQTVPAAFAALVLTKSFAEAVQAAIRAGGDTDTTAAITGALAGTHYGLSAIPKKWRTIEKFEHLHRLEQRIAKGPRSDALWIL